MKKNARFSVEEIYVKLSWFKQNGMLYLLLVICCNMEGSGNSFIPTCSFNKMFLCFGFSASQLALINRFQSTFDMNFFSVNVCEKCQNQFKFL